jgi:hypothetical protein
MVESLRFAWSSASVVRFFTLKKLFAKDIRAELEEVYGHEALCLLAVKKWCKRFANGRITLENGPRSARSHKAILLNLCVPLLRKAHLFCVSACARNFR